MNSPPRRRWSEILTEDFDEKTRRRLFRVVLVLFGITLAVYAAFAATMGDIWLAVFAISTPLMAAISVFGGTWLARKMGPHEGDPLVLRRILIAVAVLGTATLALLKLFR